MIRPNAGVPVKLRRLARQIARSPDVCGVYWGTRRRDGAWTGEPCLSVEVFKKHARRKLTAGRLLPRKIDGVRIDVIEARLVRAARMAYAPGHTASTITCIVDTKGNQSLALLSGHGVVPIVGGEMLKSYDHQPAAPVQVELRSGEKVVVGQLSMVRIAQTLDFAVARIAGGSAPTYSLGDGQVRQTQLVAGEVVHQFSTIDGVLRSGIIDIGLTPQHIDLGGGFSASIEVIRVAVGPGVKRFARLGDSGSLVVDDSGRAIGTVVAVEETADLAYVLPLYGLFNKYPGIYSRFFR